MKYFSLLFCVTLFAVTAPAPSARADVSVPVDFFYDALSPYGDWVYTDNYGYVWQPAAAQQSGWSPYADGYWAYTDAGWTWISNEDFGWATYHYGRWIRMAGNWFWVPGNEWAPAWVSWRQSDNYVGWAPLPPEAAWTSNIGFSSWTDSYYDIGPSYYNFVPTRSFATSASLLPFIVDRRQNVTYLDRSVNITNIQYRQNVVNNIFVGGPDPAHFDRLGPNHVRRLTLRRDEDEFRRNWLDNRDRRGFDGRRDFNSLSRIENNQLVVAAPSVRRENAPALPPRVRERLERPDVDRGWRNIGDASLAERLRDRQKEELAKARDGRLPDKAPTIVTSKEAPPAVGRPLRPEERQLVQRPDAGRIDEEVRKAEPSKPGMSKSATVVDQPPSRPGAKSSTPTPGSPSTSSSTIPPRNPGSNAIPGSSADSGAGRMEDRAGPGTRPGERGRPMRPGERGRAEDDIGIGPRGSEFRPVPRGVVPNEGGDRRRGGRPSDPEQSPTSPESRISPRDRSTEGPAEGLRPQPPDALTPPRTPAIPMPEARPETRVRPAPMPQPEEPRVKPAPMPRVEPGRPSTPAFPDRELQSRPPLPQRGSPQARPSMPERAAPQARPSMPDRPTPDARPFQPERPAPQARPEIPRPSQPQVQSQPPAQSRPSGPPQSQGGPGHGGPGRGGPGHGGRDR